MPSGNLSNSRLLIITVFVRQSSDTNKNVECVIHCATFETESLFSLVLSNNTHSDIFVFIAIGESGETCYHYGVKTMIKSYTIPIEIPIFIVDYYGFEVAMDDTFLSSLPPCGGKQSFSDSKIR